MFVYCNNNPINYYDSTGESAMALAEAWMAFSFLEPTLLGEIVGVVILVVVCIAIGKEIYNDALTVDNTFVSVESSTQSLTGGKDSTHGGGHWDVQSPKGGYSNVYPGGKVRGGKAPYPHIPLLP